MIIKCLILCLLLICSCSSKKIIKFNPCHFESEYAATDKPIIPIKEGNYWVYDITNGGEKTEYRLEIGKLTDVYYYENDEKKITQAYQLFNNLRVDNNYYVKCGDAIINAVADENNVLIWGESYFKANAKDYRDPLYDKYNMGEGKYNPVNIFKRTEIIQFENKDYEAIVFERLGRRRYPVVEFGKTVWKDYIDVFSRAHYIEGIGLVKLEANPFDEKKNPVIYTLKEYKTE